MPGTAVPALPAAELAGRQMTAAGRAWAAVRHWARQWLAGAGRALRKPGGLWHAQPESLAMHDAYRKSRAWVPAGQDGRFIGPAGDFYHRTFARLGLVTGYAWAGMWARPMRLAIVVAAVGGIALGFWLG